METKARLSLITSMVIFGTIGIFRKYIPLSSSVLAIARGLIGTVFLLVFLSVRKMRPSAEKIKKNLLLLVVSGAFIGINWILLFESYRYTTVAVATLCYYMAPVFVLIASPFVLKETLSRKQMGCVAAALLGMILVSGVLNSEVTGVTGILLGLGAALFYATVILLNQFIRDISAYDKTIVQLFSAAVVLIPYVLFVEGVPAVTVTPLIVFMVLLVGIVHTGIAYALYFGSMGNLPARTIALCGYIDPIVAIILSALLLHEPMSLMEVVGAVLVLCATLVSEL